MKYKARLTAFLPLRFPKHLKNKGKSILKRCNRRYEAITDASFHYISRRKDRNRKLQNLRIGSDQLLELLKGKEKHEKFFFVENRSSEDKLFDSNLDIVTMVSSERGCVRIDMLDSGGEVFYFETELYKSIVRLHKVMNAFICPLLSR